MLLELREFYLPALFLSTIVGYQIAFYFLYRYYKGKSEEFGLNKILFAYGIFFAFSFTGYLIRIINNYYITENFLIEVLNPIMIRFTLGLAVIFFLIVISKEYFHEILNPNLTKIIIIFTIFEIISIFFFQPGTPENIIAICLYIIGLVYIIIFHTKFIYLSKGIIKRKLIFVLIGEVICVGSLLIGSNISMGILFEQSNHIFSIIAILAFFSGLIIIFIGIFQIPPFLEFQWKENLLYLYIIDGKNLKGLYTCDFKKLFSDMDFQDKKNIERIKPKTYFPDGFIGIDKIITFITDTRNEKIEKIEHGKSLIFLEYADKMESSIVYALVVEKEMNSNRIFLRTVKKNFEDFYGNLILFLDFLKGREIGVFSTFDIILKKLIQSQ